MKKLVVILWILLLGLASCDTEKAPDCFQTAGKIVKKEVQLEAFEEVMVYERVKLFIQQGEEYSATIETGENLLEEVSLEVKDNRLSIRNTNACNLFRDYEVTKVYLTTPTLNWLQNSSGSAIESIGTLNFPELWLRSFNQEMDPDIHTNGDFILELNVERLRITNDNFSNYFLTGNVGTADIFFAGGDGRLEAADLIVQHYDIFHRGTNKLIVNPQQSIKGDIYGFGDVISKNRPPEVNVKEHYKGRLIFE
ncbi:head GIN domain-containing protein [Salegentibacter chungangensis]|uniref:Head GIN domain-containing protein n=1 Tax=Salegentibacter chungangensis TaxID=1335724 RepID=A0ABW3NPW6_9FLAO